MSFFDFFLSEEKKITKNRHRLTSRDSQAEDRETAARWLANNRSPKALLALLSRFDMKLEHQLNDTAEKDFLYALVLELGDDVVKPLRSWIRQCKLVGLPLQLMVELAGEDAAVQAALKQLQREFDRDDFKPLKKNALLVWLTEHPHAGALEKAALFIDDFDENVRCSAAEVMFAQHDPAAAAILEARLSNPDEDSNRLRHRVAEVFAARGWPVADAETLGPHLPDGFTIHEGRVRSR